MTRITGASYSNLVGGGTAVSIFSVNLTDGSAAY